MHAPDHVSVGLKPPLQHLIQFERSFLALKFGFNFSKEGNCPSEFRRDLFFHFHDGPSPFKYFPLDILRVLFNRVLVNLLKLFVTDPPVSI